jgi:ABC-type branched-subunit amino acid transport system substrate-binding protein/outer membrane protein assembly factor BamD (BamD/ComL family)
MPLRRILPSATVILVVLACLAMLLAAGCAPTLPPEPEWEKDARVILDQADGLFAKRQYDQASKTLDAFFTRYPKSRHADRALFLMGEIRLTVRDYRQALSYYKELIEKFPASPLIVEAKYKLGQCYFELKEYDLAISNLEDRSKITDAARLRRIAEMLSAAYVIKKNYPQAVKEYTYLAETAQNEKQRAGYRDRVREIIDKNLAADDLKSLANGTSYPADIAMLRYGSLLIQQRNYSDAIKVSKGFLERFAGHPEKTRAEMILNEATSRLTAPRYTIGALVPQSGQLAFFGDRILKGIQLAVHAYNLQDPDSRVELLVQDTEGSPEKAVAAMSELASKGIVAAVGPITTREEEALVPVLEKLQVPVIRPAASRAGFTEKSIWIFRDALTIDSQAQAAAQYALNLKLRKFVIMYPDEPYGRDLSHLFSRDLERKTEILATIAYPPETKDFGPYIRKIIEIDLRSRRIPIPDDDAERKKLFLEYTPSFDALYLPGYAERVGLLVPQLAFYNIIGKTMIGSDNWHSPDLIERAGRHADGAVFVDGFFPESTNAAIKSFVDAYRSAYQEEPDILSAQAYDAAMMVFSLLKQRRDTPLAIRDGLLALKDYPGITGSTTFQGSNEAQKNLYLIKVEDGNFVLINN